MAAGDEELFACLSLRHGLGLGARAQARLVAHFGGAVSAVRHARLWKSLDLATSRQVSAFLAESWREEAEKELAQAQSLGVQTLTWSDPGYPELLRQTPGAPILLYCKGDLSLLDNPAVAIVGSREASRYGLDLARRIAGDLSEKGLTVISGLASGIDREAHLGGLTGPGSSVAVLGAGIDVLYPSSNRDVWLSLRDKGLIVTEFSPGTKPLGANFPQRNRIIAGLSLGVVVVEAGVKSGSLITARLAMEQGREVFAVPGPVSLPSYRGCHELINQGARLVGGAEDVLMELAPQVEAFVKGKRAGGQARPAPSARGAGPDAENAFPDAFGSDPGPQWDKTRPTRGKGSPAPVSLETGPRDRRNRGATDQGLAGGPDASPAQEVWAGADAAGAPSSAGSSRASAPFGTVPADAPGATPAAHDEALPRRDPGGMEDEVAQHLAAMGATHIDSLCRVFHVEVGQMSRLLVVLELKGVVRRLPGGYYLTA